MSKWVSVKDRLPEVNESVLVCDGAEIWVDYMYKSHDDERLYFSVVEYGVTHWMPLPDMPEDK